jgi:two-component system alkaline phosphatase synthesis response regulator PhoP
VIFLSARAGEYDKIVALEIGKDDYLTMPFSMRELFARVDVGLRRSGCSLHGAPVILTVSELRILHRLL